MKICDKSISSRLSRACRPDPGISWSFDFSIVFDGIGKMVLEKVSESASKKLGTNKSIGNIWPFVVVQRDMTQLVKSFVLSKVTASSQVCNALVSRELRIVSLHLTLTLGHRENLKHIANSVHTSQNSSTIFTCPCVH